MSTRQPPLEPSDPDDDPTGIRALLAGLPEPGPMPEDLVARITASIAAEQEHRSGVRHLAPRRRSPWRSAGIAAAAAVLIGVGGTSLLTSTSPGDLATRFAGSGSDSQAATAGSARDQAAERAPGADSGARGQAAPVVSVHHTARTYSSSSFAAQVAGLLASPGATLAPNAPESPAIGPIGTERGVLACLSAVTPEPFTSVTADLGTFDGVPAAVLVLTTDTGHTAYAVQRSCTLGRAALLAGPQRIP